MIYCELHDIRTMLLVFMVNVHVVHSELRMIGGRLAIQDEYPYVAKLEVVPVNTDAVNESLTFCTASVLSTTWTLTAAHCIQFLDRYSLHHPGKQHMNMIRTEPDEALFEVLSTHKHPAFKGMIVDDLALIENDVGMLKTESISLSQYAKVSALDYTALMGQAANALGYGINVITTKWQSKQSEKLPRPLEVLDLLVVECPRLWHLYPAMCVAQRCGHNPTLCAGDSGGPLIHPSGIIAVTSVYTEKDCAVEGKMRSHTVGIFTAISPYISWIASHTVREH